MNGNKKSCFLKNLNYLTNELSGFKIRLEDLLIKEQEVEKAAQQSGYDFDGVIKPAHDKDHYRLAYGAFAVPLLKAMQELNAINNEKDKQIADLEIRLKRLELIVSGKQ